MSQMASVSSYMPGSCLQALTSLIELYRTCIRNCREFLANECVTDRVKRVIWYMHAADGMTKLCVHVHYYSSYRLVIGYSSTLPLELQLCSLVLYITIFLFLHVCLRTYAMTEVAVQKHVHL